MQLTEMSNQVCRFLHTNMLAVPVVVFASTVPDSAMLFVTWREKMVVICDDRVVSILIHP